MDRNELASNYSRNKLETIEKYWDLALPPPWPKDNKVSCVEIVMACCRSEAGSSFRNQPPKRLADSYYWSLSSEWNLLSFIFNKMREDPDTKRKKVTNRKHSTTNNISTSWFPAFLSSFHGNLQTIQRDGNDYRRRCFNTTFGLAKCTLLKS